MRFLLVINFVIIFGLNLNAQTSSENSEGAVSFLSSQNIYVKYKSTNGISIGDTLFTISNNILIPSLVVKNLSSTSIVCSPLASVKFNVNDKIIAKRRIENMKPEKSKAIKKDTLIDARDTSKVAETEKLNKKISKQKINGRVAVSNFSNFSNTPANASYVYNYSLSLNINNIGDSKFSLESNILFRQENGEWSKVQNNIFNGLKIYNLALKYELNKTSFISLGRKINPVISNIGAIDGLQAEKSFGNLFVGGFVGSRPNYLNYSFDFNLLHFGAYLGHNFQTSKSNMQNSLSVVEQTNNSKTDRRFFCFQHSSSLVKNVHLFYTLEMDFYKFLNEKKQNTLSLTNNYLSLRYQPFKKLTISGTYDSRKNIIYYETDKNYLSTLIESEIRQGFGVQANYTISKNINSGAKTGYRFQKKDSRPTKNAYAFVTYNNMFKSKISATISATMLETTYLNGNVYNIRFSRGYNSGKMNIGCGYSFVNYKIIKAELPLRQHIAEVNISTELIKKTSFSLNFETDFEKPNTFYRMYLQLRKRF